MVGIAGFEPAVSRPPAERIDQTFPYPDVTCSGLCEAEVRSCLLEQLADDFFVHRLSFLSCSCSSSAALMVGSTGFEPALRRHQGTTPGAGFVG